MTGNGELIRAMAAAVEAEGGIGADLAREFTSLDPSEVINLLPLTRRLRERKAGRVVSLCSIVNARSGRCGEDCRFCAQSSRYKTEIETYALMDRGRIVEAARESKANGAWAFSIVTSGKSIRSAKELDRIAVAVSAIRNEGLHACASLGILDKDQLATLQQAGLQRYHHNLETSRSFFSRICTTHGYDEDVAVVGAARDVGLEVCCGGLFGMGESWKHRIELAFFLRDLGVTCVPINFLNPIPGTPLENAPPLAPYECLMIVSLFRLVLPEASVTVCGGRDHALRELQCLIFDAGADGMMVGNYLTTLGRPPEADLHMIRDQGLEARRP